MQRHVDKSPLLDDTILKPSRVLCVAFEHLQGNSAHTLVVFVPISCGRKPSTE